MLLFFCVHVIILFTINMMISYICTKRIFYTTATLSHVKHSCQLQLFCHLFMYRTVLYK